MARDRADELFSEQEVARRIDGAPDVLDRDIIQNLDLAGEGIEREKQNYRG